MPQKLRVEGQLPLTVRDLFGLARQRRPIFLGMASGTDEALRRTFGEGAEVFLHSHPHSHGTPPTAAP